MQLPQQFFLQPFSLKFFTRSTPEINKFFNTICICQGSEDFTTLFFIFSNVNFKLGMNFFCNYTKTNFSVFYKKFCQFLWLFARLRGRATKTVKEENDENLIITVLSLRNCNLQFKLVKSSRRLSISLNVDRLQPPQHPSVGATALDGRKKHENEKILAIDFSIFKWNRKGFKTSIFPLMEIFLFLF